MCELFIFVKISLAQKRVREEKEENRKLAKVLGEMVKFETVMWKNVEKNGLSFYGPVFFVNKG